MARGSTVHRWTFPGVTYKSPEYNRLVREARRSMGLCAKCNVAALDGHTMCQKHLDQQNRYTRERYKQDRKASRCVACGAKVKVTQRKCDWCVKSERAAFKRRRDEAKARGLCSVCAKRKQAPGRMRCKLCIAAHNEMKARVRLRRVRAAEFRQLFRLKPGPVAERMERLLRGGVTRGG